MKPPNITPASQLPPSIATEQLQTPSQQPLQLIAPSAPIAATVAAATTTTTPTTPTPASTLTITTTASTPAATPVTAPISTTLTSTSLPILAPQPATSNEPNTSTAATMAVSVATPTITTPITTPTVLAVQPTTATITLTPTSITTATLAGTAAAAATTTNTTTTTIVPGTTIPTIKNTIPPPQPILTTAKPLPTLATTSQVQQAPLALTTQSPQLQAPLPMQLTAIQLQTPITTHVSNITPITTHVSNLTPITTHVSNITTHVSNITPILITAHQQPTTIAQHQPLANRPPSTLPVVPMNAAPIVKSEPNKYICCLLDNGIRCDRVAGNASFSARIQKIVGTKKMNFALDPTVRHAYICEHHKGIITVAKKSTTPARDSKSNARNHAPNNNNATALAPQPNSNYDDMSMRQQTVQHPVNMDLLVNQNRLANNHAGPLDSVPMRQGTQIAYSHYQGAHPSQQVGSMDVMMSSSFDSAGGDSIPSSSGGVDVDLQQLQVNTLRRYKRHFRVQTRPGLNKLQLAESLKTHFRTLPIIEKEAITYFVYIVKCFRNKLDHNPKAD